MNMAAVIMDDSGCKYTMTVMTHDLKYRSKRRFVVSYLLMGLINTLADDILDPTSELRARR